MVHQSVFSVIYLPKKAVITERTIALHATSLSYAKFLDFWWIVCWLVKDWLVLYLNTNHIYFSYKYKIQIYIFISWQLVTLYILPRPLPAASSCSSLRQHKNWEGAGEVERPKSFPNLGQDLRMYSVRNVTINGGNPWHRKALCVDEDVSVNSDQCVHVSSPLLDRVDKELRTWDQFD